MTPSPRRTKSPPSSSPTAALAQSGCVLAFQVKFTVHTRTRIPEFAKGDVSVTREHDEFIWLHDVIQDNDVSSPPFVSECNEGNWAGRPTLVSSSPRRRPAPTSTRAGRSCRSWATGRPP